MTIRVQTMAQNPAIPQDLAGKTFEAADTTAEERAAGRVAIFNNGVRQLIDGSWEVRTQGFALDNPSGGLDTGGGLT